MPQGKKWLLDEKTALAKAYVAACQNPFQGADQTLTSFTADLVAKFKHFSPADVDDGRFFKRSDLAILDESRSMKKDVQRVSTKHLQSSGHRSLLELPRMKRSQWLLPFI
jgi:hypothetical protein